MANLKLLKNLAQIRAFRLFAPIVNDVYIDPEKIKRSNKIQ